MSRFFIFLLALFIFDDEQTGVSGSFTDEIRLQPELSDNTVPGSEMNTGGALPDELFYSISGSREYFFAGPVKDRVYDRMPGKGNNAVNSGSYADTLNTSKSLPVNEGDTVAVPSPGMDSASLDYVTVSTNTYTITELVEDVLIDSPCAVISNIQHSSSCGIGSFQANNSAFPFTEGVVLRSGNVADTQGPFTDINNSTVCTDSIGTDFQLQAISNAQGQLSTVQDVTYLEFDFTPLTDNFSFNFLFASNEYGEFQCNFADVFGFILTNLSTSEVTNLAVVPGTSMPVSVNSIRSSLYNTVCPSANDLFFGQYNPFLPSAQTAINMRGQTTVMQASAVVVPNTPYRIKLVIGDYQDTDYDSAVFIEAGSFTIGSANIVGTGIYGGYEGDYTIANTMAFCANTCHFIQAGSSPIANAGYQWFLDGVLLPGENNYNLEVCAPGTYSVIVTIGDVNSGCVLTDDVIIEFYPDHNTGTAGNLLSCTGFFDLTVNQPLLLNGLPGSVSFYLSQMDAEIGLLSLTNVSNYFGFDNQEIFARVQIGSEPCYEIVSFFLEVMQCPTINLDPINPLLLCDPDQDGLEVFDLSLTDVLNQNNLSPAQYLVSYYNSQSDAENGNNPILTPFSYIGTNETIYVRVEDFFNPQSYGVQQFILSVIQVPVIDTPADVVSCTPYTLPALTQGAYYSAPGGTGTPYAAGDVINSDTTLYIYSQSPADPSCFAEHSFMVSIVDLGNRHCPFGVLRLQP